MTDSMAWYANAPHLVKIQGGWFVIYIEGNGQRLIWFDEYGHLVHQQYTTQVANVYGAYAAGSLTNIVEYRSYWLNDWFYMVLVHAYDFSGQCLAVDTLYHEALPDAWSSHALRMDARNGQLLAILLASDEASADSSIWYARTLRYASGQSVIGDWSRFAGTTWYYGYLTSVATALGPWDSGLLGFNVVDEDTQIAHVCAFDSNGVLHETRPMIGSSEFWLYNCFDVLSVDQTVYFSYTAQSDDNPQERGAYVTAFPVSDILGAEDTIVPQPASYGLSAYPNPFNAQTTITFTLPRPVDVNFTIYNVTGRKVQTLLNEHKSAGTHAVRFNADELPSGVYLCRMQAGDAAQTSKLLLIK